MWDLTYPLCLASLYEWSIVYILNSLSSNLEERSVPCPHPRSKMEYPQIWVIQTSTATWSCRIDSELVTPHTNPPSFLLLGQTLGVLTWLVRGLKVSSAYRDYWISNQQMTSPRVSCRHWKGVWEGIKFDAPHIGGA